jgi:hypothetical protein
MITIQVSINELDEKILKHELLDIQAWVQDAVNGKVNNIKNRLLKEAQEKLFEDKEVQSIPGNVEGMLELYFSRPYYLNREQKIKEETSSTQV